MKDRKERKRERREREKHCPGRVWFISIPDGTSTRYERRASRREEMLEGGIRALECARTSRRNGVVMKSTMEELFWRSLSWWAFSGTFWNSRWDILYDAQLFNFLIISINVSGATLKFYEILFQLRYSYGIFQVKSAAQNFKIAQKFFTLSILWKKHVPKILGRYLHK